MARRSRFLIAVLLLFYVGLAFAKQGNPDPAFKSPDAKKAVIAHAVATHRAKEDHDKRLEKAKKQLLTGSEVAMKDATKAGDLDEAVKFRDAVKKYEAESPATPRTADELLVLAAKTRKLIVGTWAVETPGAKKDWVSKSDGTVSTRDDKGMWTVELDRNRVFIHWFQDRWETFELPLDPKSTRGDSYVDPGKNKVMAIKQK
jgi:hypothetical protein